MAGMIGSPRQLPRDGSLCLDQRRKRVFEVRIRPKWLDQALADRVQEEVGRRRQWTLMVCPEVITSTATVRVNGTGLTAEYDEYDEGRRIISSRRLLSLMGSQRSSLTMWMTHVTMFIHHDVPMMSGTGRRKR
jgi:hypothetical protein